MQGQVTTTYDLRVMVIDDLCTGENIFMKDYFVCVGLVLIFCFDTLNIKFNIFFILLCESNIDKGHVLPRTRKTYAHFPSAAPHSGLSLRRPASLCRQIPGLHGAGRAGASTEAGIRLLPGAGRPARRGHLQLRRAAGAPDPAGAGGHLARLAGGAAAGLQHGRHRHPGAAAAPVGAAGRPQSAPARAQAEDLAAGADGGEWDGSSV